MPESGGPGWAEFTPRELVNMTADGHLRSWSDFRATHPAPVIEAALRGFPIPPLLLWKAPEGVLWVLDGAPTVAAFSERWRRAILSSTRSAARWWSAHGTRTRT